MGFAALLGINPNTGREPALVVEEIFVELEFANTVPVESNR